MVFALGTALNTAVSGLDAAGRRLQVSANNTANSQSAFSNVDGETTNNPYVPQEVLQSSIETGGVQTYTRDATVKTAPVYSPDNPAANDEGFVNYPNVDGGSEAVNMILANNSYRASLQVIKASNEMMENLLDIEG